jgi:hypothetical protein
MPRFDLGKPFQQEYHIARLTPLRDRCGAELAICDPEDKWWSLNEIKELKGQLVLELSDSQGKVVLNVKGPLGTFVWNTQAGMHSLYKSPDSFFTPDIDEHYLLRLSYTPDPRLGPVW